MIQEKTMTIKTAVVKPGEELPCHRQNIIHTEDLSGIDDIHIKNYLRVWYIEVEGTKK